jgi:hypothetical protein
VKDKESFRRRRASHQKLNQEEKGKPGASLNSPTRSTLVGTGPIVPARKGL